MLKLLKEAIYRVKRRNSLDMGGRNARPQDYDTVVWAAEKYEKVSPLLNRLVELRGRAPEMHEIEALNTQMQYERNISITEKGRELGTVNSIAIAAKMQDAGGRSKAFYEEAANITNELKEIIGE